jgi:hypothetical protein
VSRAVTERPILFNDAMVKAILDGRKTVTRRLVKPAPVRVEAHDERIGTTGDGKPIRVHCPAGWRWRDTYAADGVDVGAALRVHCPYGAPGDRLWVREAWAPLDADYAPIAASTPDVSRDVERGRMVHAACRADHVDARGDGPHALRWRPSIHMPRWASRLTLEVVSVRVERLHEIGSEDARAEGLEWVPHMYGVKGVAAFWWHGDPVQSFRALWDSINADRAPWASNPWVWRVEFRRVSA